MSKEEHHRSEVDFKQLFVMPMGDYSFAPIFASPPPKDRKRDRRTLARRRRTLARRMKQTHSWGLQAKTCWGEKMWCPPFRDVVL